MKNTAKAKVKDMNIYRIFVEKKDNLHAKKVKEEIRNLLKINASDVRSLI